MANPSSKFSDPLEQELWQAALNSRLHVAMMKLWEAYAVLPQGWRGLLAKLLGKYPHPKVFVYVYPGTVTLRVDAGDNIVTVMICHKQEEDDETSQLYYTLCSDLGEQSTANVELLLSWLAYQDFTAKPRGE